MQMEGCAKPRRRASPCGWGPNCSGAQRPAGQHSSECCCRAEQCHMGQLRGSTGRASSVLQSVIFLWLQGEKSLVSFSDS